MNFELYFSKILFSLYTEIKYEISLFYLKNFFTFVRKLNFYLDSLHNIIMSIFAQLYNIPRRPSAFFLLSRIMFSGRIDIIMA